MMRKIKLSAILILLFSGQLAWAANNEVSVVINAFSGQANPIVVVSLNDDEAVASSLADLIAAVKNGELTATDSAAGDSNLGYKGVDVFDPSGEVLAADVSINVTNDVVTVSQGGTSVSYINTVAGLEQAVFELAHQQGKIDKRLHMRLSVSQ